MGRVASLSKEDGVIRAAYVLSVLDLRHVCKKLTSNEENRGNTFGYRLLRPNDGCVLIRFSDDPTDFGSLNSLCFSFPMVAKFSGLARLHRNDEAGQIVCLSEYTADQKQYGLYEEEGDFARNREADWERFWVPLAAFLQWEIENV